MTTTTAPTLGALIRQARTERDLTQFEVSMLTGIGQPEISGYERGRAVPSMPTLAKFADGLDLSDDELARWIKAVAA